MKRYDNPNSVLLWSALIALAIFLIWFFGWQEEGWLISKIKYLIRAIT